MKWQNSAIEVDGKQLLHDMQTGITRTWRSSTGVLTSLSTDFVLDFLSSSAFSLEWLDVMDEEGKLVLTTGELLRGVSLLKWFSSSGDVARIAAIGVKHRNCHTISLTMLH